jgi:hypothetical protein
LAFGAEHFIHIGIPKRVSGAFLLRMIWIGKPATTFPDHACGARLPAVPGSDALEVRRNVGRTAGIFQCRMRIING